MGSRDLKTVCGMKALITRMLILGNVEKSLS